MKDYGHLKLQYLKVGPVEFLHAYNVIITINSNNYTIFHSTKFSKQLVYVFLTQDQETLSNNPLLETSFNSLI
jgi:hypothetical protein